MISLAFADFAVPRRHNSIWDVSAAVVDRQVALFVCYLINLNAFLARKFDRIGHRPRSEIIIASIDASDERFSLVPTPNNNAFRWSKLWVWCKFVPNYKTRFSFSSRVRWWVCVSFISSILNATSICDHSPDFTSPWKKKAKIWAKTSWNKIKKIFALWPKFHLIRFWWPQQMPIKRCEQCEH